MFEGYNRIIRNWYYTGLPTNMTLRMAGYAWSFATIWPAIFEGAELMAVLRGRPPAPPPRPAPPSPAAFPALMIALGVITAVAIARRRWEASGGDPDDISAVATWGVPAGLVGARLYHIITDYRTFEGHWGDVLREYLRGVDGLQLTPGAHESMRLIMAPPMPLPLRPFWVLPASAAVASLPRFARRMYGLPWFEPASMSVRVAMFGLTRFLNVLPIEAPEIREAKTRLVAAA